MIHPLHRLSRTAALIVASGLAMYAAGEGSLAATIVDVSGKAVANATVVISSPTQIGGSRTLVTDGSGKVRFPRLQAGRFHMVVTANGYQTQTLNDVEVLVDQTANVNLKMIPVGGAIVEVVSSVPTVDVTTVTAGTQVTQEEISVLPVQRTQLATINLAPGVVSLSATVGGGGNPGLAGGLGRDNLGNNGARNNTYMVDGMDVTSPETGTYRTTIPQELIQNQDVKTGAITAEYSARAGLFSNVTTIPGSNDFSGGLVYARLDPSLGTSTARFHPVAPDRTVDDTTVFLSGPILKDKLWFVASFQKVKDIFDVKVDPQASVVPGETRKSVNNDEQRTFAKLTWQIADGHQLVGSYDRNPGSFDNGTVTTTPSVRLTKTERGGNRYSLDYTWQTPKFILDVKTFKHKESDTTLANSTAQGPQVDVIFPLAVSPSVDQTTFGNSSAGTGREYERKVTRVDGTFFFDALGTHALKAGIQTGRDQLTQTISVSGGAAYQNFSQAVTYGTVNSAAWGGNAKGAISKVQAAINGQAAYATLKASLDTNSDGTVDLTELGAVNFNTLYDPSNPNKGYLGYRIIQASSASSTPKMEYGGFYVQDQWQIGRVAFTPGFRADKYEYKADNGQSLFKTDWAFAPRVGISYDVNGDGRTKAYAYWGRYIDPIKLDMVRFTGSLTSSVRNEDIYINGTWVTENVRGGSKVVDAVFANTFKLPKTDEFRVGLARDFGNSWTIEGVYTYRHDFDIVEDWDPTLYTSANALEASGRAQFGLGATPYASLSTQGKKVVDSYRALAIDPEYFAGGGYTGAQNVSRVAGGTLNFVLANLPGARRVFNQFDVTITRKFKDHWGGYYTFTSVRAEGNSNSSGNADFQGDLAQYDPRLPYTNGKLEGSIDWQHKMFLYYKWDTGFQASMAGYWNSGYHYSDANLVSTRVLQVSPVLADFNTEQLGRNRTPDVKYADARVQYGQKFDKLKGEIFVDVFNVFNRQTAVDIAEGNGVRPGYSKGEAYTYLLPRRIQVGFKLTF